MFRKHRSPADRWASPPKRSTEASQAPIERGTPMSDAAQFSTLSSKRKTRMNTATNNNAEAINSAAEPTRVDQLNDAIKNASEQLNALKAERKAAKKAARTPRSTGFKVAVAAAGTVVGAGLGFLGYKLLTATVEA